jgi:hypothetical protein
MMAKSRRTGVIGSLAGMEGVPALKTLSGSKRFPAQNAFRLETLSD